MATNTPTATSFEFPDAKGLMFSYDPTENGDRGAFDAWARRQADKFKAVKHDHLVAVGDDDSRIFAELMPDEDSRFFVVIPQGESLSLNRAQVESLRDGLTRLLATDELAQKFGPVEREHEPTFWAMEVGYFVSEVGVSGIPEE